MYRLLIFLKEPVPGKVKTRLASELDAEAACEIYRACVELTLRRLEAFRTQAVLCIDPPQAAERIQAWIGAGWTVRPQRGRTLGERLVEATAAAFSEGATRVAVIGTDSPWLAASDLDDAFAALESADAVIGPAEDGGYYVLGLARSQPRLFEGIAWSTSFICAQTQAQAAWLGLRLARLATGYDVDQLADVHRFIEDERRGGTLQQTVQSIERALNKAQGSRLKAGGEALEP